MSVSDEALVAGMASSHHESAAVFVRRYQRRVFGLALAVLGDRDAASDVAQEAFVRVWRHAPGSQPALVAPSGLDARALSRSQIRLRWQDNAGTETGTRIERCTGVGCTNFVEIATVATNVTEHVDSNLARNTQYTYRVRAFNAQATSQYSNTAGAKTLRH